jgi:Zn-dependent protease with chaperone function
MRFEPRTPDTSVNVSKTHPLAEAGTLLVGLAGLFAVITLLIVFAIELLIRFVPAEREVEWLSGWTPLNESEANHPQATAASALLARLSAHWPDTDYEFRLEISEDPAPNAMALPGGLIIVTQGLLDQVESENALAFVLGHELGHFRNRDHIRQLGRATALGLFMSAMSASGSNNSLGYGFADLTLRGFNREQEREADIFGLLLVEREYGHVESAFEFFESINSEHHSMLRWDNYLGTHPDPQDRLDELRALAIASEWRMSGPVNPWPPADELATAPQPE